MARLPDKKSVSSGGPGFFIGEKMKTSKRLVPEMSQVDHGASHPVNLLSVNLCIPWGLFLKMIKGEIRTESGKGRVRP